MNNKWTDEAITINFTYLAAKNEREISTHQEATDDLKHVIWNAVFVQPICYHYRYQ